MNIHESSENYLETILILSRKIANVRAIDIALEMGFSKPSVSVALKKLRENGYLRDDSDLSVVLTDTGRKIAEETLEKHEFLSKWLISMGVSEETAMDDACKIEHVLSAESFKKLKEHIHLD